MTIHTDSTLRWFGTVFFFAAVIHTFLANYIKDFSTRFTEKSVSRKIFEFLGEIEIVFGFWALIFLISLSSNKLNIEAAIDYLNNTNFSEVVFIFAMMCMSYTKPVMDLANSLINSFSKILSKIFRLSHNMAIFYSIFIFGALSGSFITEPVAMTVCALLLNQYFFHSSSNKHFKYSMLGLLFVNISIGGTLTTYSAPPILMIAQPWHLTTASLFALIGWKTIISVVTSTILTSICFKKDICVAEKSNHQAHRKKTPYPIIAINIGFLLLAIMYHKYAAFVVPLFVLFLGFYEVTKEYQKKLKMRESLMVGFFIGGIVVLGGLQSWWITPIIKSTDFHTIFFGTIGLSAITDNVAITYLASQIPNLSNDIKYAFLSAAVGAGGLTVIANAPNPIGYRILSDSFGKSGIKPIWLLVGALSPTIITLLSFTFL